MTMQEAKQALNAGKKVCHPHMIWKYAELKYGEVLNKQIWDDNGYLNTYHGFWTLRSHPVFDNGWEIYAEETGAPFDEPNCFNPNIK